MTTKTYPLASNQKDIWFDQAVWADLPLYNIGGYLRINGEVDATVLNAAIEQLIVENDALRIVIKENDAQNVSQCISDNISYQLKSIDFSELDDPEIKAVQWVDDAFKIPFCLSDDARLWQFSLLKIHSHCYFLMTKYHHLIADGWTTKIVIARLAEIYNALLKGHIPAAGSKHCYADYLEQEQSYLSSNAFSKDKEYWSELLPNLPSPLIVKKHRFSDVQSLPVANIHRFHLNRDFYKQLENFSKESRITTYHLLLSAVALYFARIYQREDIVFGVPSLNRSGARYKDVLGMFISLSPILLRMNLSANVETLLRQCGKVLRDNYRHQRFPLSEINKRLGMIQHQRDSIFDIVISYERQEYSTPFGGAGISAHQQFSGVSRYPLGVTICEFNDYDDVEIILEGAETFFSDQELEQFGKCLKHILAQMVNKPQIQLKEIELLSAPEKQLLLQNINSPDEISPFPGSVIQLFQQQVAEDPETVVLQSGSISLTRQQLDEQSNQLAHYLIEQGAKPEKIIAISLPRRVEMIIGLLAILKTGAAYLPIDPDTPIKRIRYMLQQCDALALLSIEEYQKQFTSINSQLIIFEAVQSQLNQASVKQTDITSLESDLAYVIFTSGSSGEPKGVLLEHGGLSRRLLGLAKLFGIKRGDRIGQSVQFNFDPSIIEIFLPLIQGGCLVLAPERNQTPDEMADFVIINRINMLALVPSGLRALSQGLSKKASSDLRVVCCGGEVLSADLARQFTQLTQAKLFNVYGPTETLILATAWEHSDSKSDEITDLPIGRPIDDSRVYIIDQHNKLMPTGVMGEIVIGGIIARGYLHNEKLMSDKFISNVFVQADSERNDERLYKTGDIGYIDFDGQLYFKGRIDRQIKISGYRIEPGEIESVLERHSKVRLAAVTTFEEQGNKVLYAYVEWHSRPESDIKNNDLQDLSALLQQSLPEYMQPRSLIAMTRIPVSSSGKIDYSALLMPLSKPSEQNQKLPRSTLETHLMQYWEEVLDKHELSITDNFFDFGGDSLSAIKLIKKIEILVGHHCPLSFILENSTIEQQAEVLSRELPLAAVPLLTTLSENNNAASLYLAASGHGDAIRFSKLATELGDVCSLHMLQPSGESIEHKTIEELAHCYAELIMIREEPAGYIGGFSIGGITALETARILTEKGQPPLGVLLLDTVYPHRLLKSPILYSLLRLISKIPLFNQIPINGRRLDTMLNDPGIRTQLMALREYHLVNYNGPVSLFISSGLWGKKWFFSYWKPFIGANLKHYSITGMHGGIFQAPHLRVLSNAIKAYLKK
ncbi:MAG: amino acid adenylation domain-containing protein [Gammaproteobacteria bacterium]|nr:amino acid adenylation domain-containing protein [Gammaproteobacteria bacterium]